MIGRLCCLVSGSRSCIRLLLLLGLLRNLSRRLFLIIGPLILSLGYAFIGSLRLRRIGIEVIDEHLWVLHHALGGHH